MLKRCFRPRFLSRRKRQPLSSSSFCRCSRHYLLIALYWMPSSYKTSSQAETRSLRHYSSGHHSHWWKCGLYFLRIHDRTSCFRPELCDGRGVFGYSGGYYNALLSGQQGLWWLMACLNLMQLFWLWSFFWREEGLFSLYYGIYIVLRGCLISFTIFLYAEKMRMRLLCSSSILKSNYYSSTDSRDAFASADFSLSAWYSSTAAERF